MTFFQTDSGAQSGHQASGTGCEADPHAVNVGNAERWLSALAGGAIAAAGFRSRSRLGLLAIIGGGALVYRGLKGHCMTYAALGLSTADHDPATPHAYFEHGVHVEEVMTINRTPWELYAFWRDFSNLPRFMRHVKSVDVIDAKRSRWSVEDPAGRTIEWDAEIINDEPNALIAWRSLGDAGVDNARLGALRAGRRGPRHRGARRDRLHPPRRRRRPVGGGPVRQKSRRRNSRRPPAFQARDGSRYAG